MQNGLTVKCISDSKAHTIITLEFFLKIVEISEDRIMSLKEDCFK